MTTMQPLKNEQAVVPMVSDRTSPHANSQLVQQLQQAQQTKPSTATVSNSKPAGDTVMVAADAAIRQVALHGDSSTQAVKAQAVRTASVVEAHMAAAKEAITGIVKNYPPFLMGDEKRVQYLMSISSFRAQIEAMTVPPKNSAHPMEARKIWTNLFQDVNIPVLTPSGPNEASDAQLQQALTQVDAMQSQLADRSAALQQSLTPVSMAPQVAEYISQSVGQGLSGSATSLTTTLTGALKSL
jgi:hypothetical protein